MLGHGLFLVGARVALQLLERDEYPVRELVARHRELERDVLSTTYRLTLGLRRRELGLAGDFLAIVVGENTRVRTVRSPLVQLAFKGVLRFRQEVLIADSINEFDVNQAVILVVDLDAAQVRVLNLELAAGAHRLVVAFSLSFGRLIYIGASANGLVEPTTPLSHFTYFDVTVFGFSLARLLGLRKRLTVLTNQLVSGGGFTRLSVEQGLRAVQLHLDFVSALVVGVRQVRADLRHVHRLTLVSDVLVLSQNHVATA